MARKARLLPNGIPKKIRCYDNGGTSIDRYTVVFSGNYQGREGQCYYLGMNGRPFHPQGICVRDSSSKIIDQPVYSHLGRKIRFEDLPTDCQKAVMTDYLDFWRLRN